MFPAQSHLRFQPRRWGWGWAGPEHSKPQASGSCPSRNPLGALLLQGGCGWVSRASSQPRHPGLRASPWGAPRRCRMLSNLWSLYIRCQSHLATSLWHQNELRYCQISDVPWGTKSASAHEEGCSGEQQLERAAERSSAMESGLQPEGVSWTITSEPSLGCRRSDVSVAGDTAYK